MENIKRVLELGKLSLTSSEEKELEASLEQMLFFVETIKDFRSGGQIDLRSASAVSRNVFFYEPSMSFDKDIFNAFIGIYESAPDSVSVKDNILVKGLPCTAGSFMLENHIASYDADAIIRLKAAGLKICGKTNMDEFAMGGASLTSFTGPVKNPYNSELIAGGSSGGAAVSVASGLCRYALGSDTGGSLRQPCAFMGLTGLKPTYNNVSRHGLIAYASSFDQIGPVCRNARDAKYIFDIISEGRYKAAPADHLRLLIPDNLIAMSDDADKIMDSLGLYGASEICHFDMPYIDVLLSCYYIIACAEASSNLGRYDGDRYKERSEGFGFEVKKRISLGNFVLSKGFYDEYYMRAKRAASEITSLINGILTPGSVILMPVTYGAAPKVSDYDKDPLRKYSDDVFTVLSNITGLPSVTFPIGIRPDGSPIGIQLMGEAGSEELLLKTAMTARGESYV